MNKDYPTGGLSSEPLEPDARTGEAGRISFAQFDLWMDNQLEDLVARWVHTAAPNAARLALFNNRFNKLVPGSKAPPA